MKPCGFSLGTAPIQDEHRRAIVARHHELRHPYPELRRCVSLDLEVSPENGSLLAAAVHRADTGDSLSMSERPSAGSLQRLERVSEGANFLLGHNIIAFDIPHLQAVNPNLSLLKLPVVDTLRLNPLAFPRHPYHHLVKHYKDGGLVRRQVKDPLLDSKLAVEAFANQLKKLEETPLELLTAWHWLTSTENGAGFDLVFSALRGAALPTLEDAKEAIQERLEGEACLLQAQSLVDITEEQGWPLAYALAWLSVAGTNSVMPPWVLFQFPQASRLVKQLRDTPCQQAECQWCREHHDPARELNRWFGFESFRPKPADADGKPLQERIVQKAMLGEDLLAILPTGTGKSVCYQVPALSRYDKTGSLTVVISPLVALMADQVASLEKQGIGSCVTVNGLLSMPERRNALDRVRLGEASILLISPEQLRSRSLRNALEQRQIGAWVLDEAHCLSKWGHDFRPDYRYIGRCIQRRGGGEDPPPILCLTATAKPDVKQEIFDYFQDTLNIDLDVLDGGTERANLHFRVVPTTEALKLAHLHDTLESYLPGDLDGGAIIYCATRRNAEKAAEFLVSKGVGADHFHAGLTPERKKQVQDDFIEGRLRAIAATNAFGMGIDKRDVRLVIHADIPGSLENYLQEAGRAGRDNDAAHCVLLYTNEDIERQYGMTARSRLTRAEINAVLKSLRNLGPQEEDGRGGGSHHRGDTAGGRGARVPAGHCHRRHQGEDGSVLAGGGGHPLQARERGEHLPGLPAGPVHGAGPPAYPQSRQGGFVLPAATHTDRAPADQRRQRRGNYHRRAGRHHRPDQRGCAQCHERPGPAGTGLQRRGADSLRAPGGSASVQATLPPGRSHGGGPDKAHAGAGPGPGGGRDCKSPRTMYQ